MPYGPSPSDGPRRSFREARAKRVRIMVELTPADYEVLKRWLARAGEELDQPASDTTLTQAIRAMIRATAADQIVNDVVLGLMRAEQP
jgi:hypothetical protein